LGCLHTAAGQYERAEELLDRAAAIHHRASQGLDHAYVQVALGELYEAQGDYARAQVAFERAARKLERARGNRWEQRARAGVERLGTKRLAPEWVLGEHPTGLL
jgi:tetratricopeptide (TPR) repeat protein